jgi:hypothetical protein
MAPGLITQPNASFCIDERADHAKRVVGMQPPTLVLRLRDSPLTRLGQRRIECIAQQISQHFCGRADISIDTN